MSYHTPEGIASITASKISSKNPNWVGDKVKYGGLHDWVKRRLPRPTSCSNCHEPKKVDLANISQQYKRDITDWEWLCRKCHMIKDGRYDKALANLARGRETRLKRLKLKIT